jgi:peroxiredoxin
MTEARERLQAVDQSTAVPHTSPDKAHDEPWATGSPADVQAEKPERPDASDIKRALADRLVGRRVPSVVLESFQGRPVHLESAAVRVVFYFYPGLAGWREDGQDAVLLDAVQHRVFHEHQPDFEARGYSTIGVSSQSRQLQGESALAHEVGHLLLSDPELLVAGALALPTFEADGACWYERLTLVARLGRIEKVFYPVASPARSAAQVIAWMQVLGI